MKKHFILLLLFSFVGCLTTSEDTLKSNYYENYILPKARFDKVYIYENDPDHEFTNHYVYIYYKNEYIYEDTYLDLGNSLYRYIWEMKVGIPILCSYEKWEKNKDRILELITKKNYDSN